MSAHAYDMHELVDTTLYIFRPATIPGAYGPTAFFGQRWFRAPFMLGKMHISLNAIDTRLTMHEHKISARSVPGNSRTISGCNASAPGPVLGKATPSRRCPMEQRRYNRPLLHPADRHIKLKQNHRYCSIPTGPVPTRTGPVEQRITGWSGRFSPNRP